MKTPKTQNPKKIPTEFEIVAKHWEWLKANIRRDDPVQTLDRILDFMFSDPLKEKRIIGKLSSSRPYVLAQKQCTKTKDSSLILSLEITLDKTVLLATNGFPFVHIPSAIYFRAFYTYGGRNQIIWAFSLTRTAYYYSVVSKDPILNTTIRKNFWDKIDSHCAEMLKSVCQDDLEFVNKSFPSNPAFVFPGPGKIRTLEEA